MAGSFDEVAKNQQGSGELGGSIVQKPTLSSSYLFNSPDTSSRPSEPSDFSVNITSSSPLNSAKSEATVKRSRPSFLDSLNISRAPETQYQHPEIQADLVTSSGSQLSGSDGFGPSYISGRRDSNGPSSLTSGASDYPNPFEKFRSSLYPAANGVMPGFTDFSMPKQNDDFTALEQVRYLFLAPSFILLMYCQLLLSMVFSFRRTKWGIDLMLYKDDQIVKDIEWMPLAGWIIIFLPCLGLLFDFSLGC
jgi:hypothetical protein